MQLNQVTLPVRDLRAAVDFYEALGLRLIVWADHGYARLECSGGDRATLSLHLRDGPVAPGPMIYFEVADLDAQVARLEKAGITFDSGPTDQPWLWREARTRDPSGHPVCLYQAGENRRFPPWRV